MSHTTAIKGLAIKDVSAIRSAAAKLKNQGVNCTLVENAAPRMYYPDQYRKDHGRSSCEFVLKLHDSEYDLGFELQKDGTYAPIFDEFSSYISGQLGASCPMPNTPEGRAQHKMGKFLQGYAVDAATNAAIQSGYMVESADIDQQGNVQLVLTGM
jgi:hypothetical protein